jgi:hypothetical protein
MRNLDNYSCEGQLNLLDYLEEIKLPAYCEDCIFLEKYKCSLEKGQCIEGSKSLINKDGWKRIKRFRNNVFGGEYPACKEWQEVNTFHYDDVTDKFAYTKARAKDRTFIWEKEDQVDGYCIAWKYKKGECF